MLKHTMGILITFAFGLACAQTGVAKDPAPVPDVPLIPEQITETARKDLFQKGISPDFLGEIELKYTRKKNWIQSSLKLIEPNVYGFLYQGDYMKHDSKRARKKTSRYLMAHHHSFLAAEKRYRVSAESIAALLWVETKLGNDMGQHAVPFVFYSIALASQPSVCREMEKLLPIKLDGAKTAEKPDAATAARKLEERCKQKSEWAISELKELSRLHESGKLDAFKLRGSFAGAFGIPQFLPSSYAKYAISEYRKKPNLFLISDAILSVGNFLKQNGWKPDSTDSQAQALYAYNRSRDYGVVILQMAEQLGEI